MNNMQSIISSSCNIPEINLKISRKEKTLLYEFQVVPFIIERYCDDNH